MQNRSSSYIVQSYIRELFADSIFQVSQIYVSKFAIKKFNKKTTMEKMYTFYSYCNVLKSMPTLGGSTLRPRSSVVISCSFRDCFIRVTRMDRKSSRDMIPLSWESLQENNWRTDSLSRGPNASLTWK